MVNKNIIIVTQARIGSSRFPEKVLQTLGDGTMLSTHLNRLKKSKMATQIIVATTHEAKVESIIEIANDLDIKVYQGSTHDVLDRFYRAVEEFQPDLVVRVTSDCPLLDAKLIDDVIEMVINENLDYGANILKEEFPDGQDVEVFKFSALQKAWESATLPSEREHVTPYIRNNSSFLGGAIFKSNNFYAPENYNHVRMTVDEPSDLETIALAIQKNGIAADWLTYTHFILENLKNIKNQTIIRNEGYLKSIQQDNHGKS